MRNLSSAATLLAALTLVTAGCGPPAALQIVAEGPPVALEALAVDAVDLRVAGTQAWHRYEKTRDVLAAVEARPGLDAIAPWELNVIDHPARPRGWLTRSTLAPRARDAGVPIAAVGVLTASVEEATQAETLSRERRELLSRERRYASRLVVRLALLHPSSDRVLARWEDTLDEDRFVDVPDFDQRPAITRLLREAVQRFLDSLADADVIAEAAPPEPATPLVLRESPAPVITFASGGPSLADSLPASDPVAREALLYARFRYFDPGLSLEAFHRLAALPEGLLVTGGAAWGVAPGDLVLCADDRPVAWSFQWRRAWRRHPPGRLVVLHQGRRVRVRLPFAGEPPEEPSPDCAPDPSDQ